MTPAISTHHQLAAILFHEHGIQPTKVVEADDEFVVSSLVMSGVGIALMREDLALEKVRTGEICLWRDVRLSTTLQFIYARERQYDPAMGALLQTLEEVWHLSPPRPFGVRRITGRARLAACAQRTFSRRSGSYARDLSHAAAPKPAARPVAKHALKR